MPKREATLSWTGVLCACVVGLFFSASSPAAAAQASEEFYRGKQITMLVGSGAGGGYDVYARVFSRYATKHIPGNPTFIAKNVPSAGGMVAANTLYNSAERDGLTIGALTNSSGLDPLLGSEGVRFDAQKLIWIGSIGKLQNVCATWHTSPVKSIGDVRAREVMVAGAGATTNTVIIPNILNKLMGTKFKVIAGYDPGSGLTIAVESGETEGICGLGWSTLKAARPDWVTNKRLNILLQLGLEKLPDLPDVPSALDLIDDAENRKVLELILMRQEMGRPFAAPPGVAMERVNLLRAGFDATMKDPDFLAEAKRGSLDIDPISGKQIEALLAKAYGSSPSVIKEASTLLSPPGASRP